MDYKKKFAAEVNKRLEQYGEPTGTTPNKYQKYCGTRSVIRMRMEAMGQTLPHGNAPLSLESYQTAKGLLDIILPYRGQ